MITRALVCQGPPRTRRRAVHGLPPAAQRRSGARPRPQRHPHLAPGSLRRCGARAYGGRTGASRRPATTATRITPLPKRTSRPAGTAASATATASLGGRRGAGGTRQTVPRPALWMPASRLSYSYWTWFSGRLAPRDRVSLEQASHGHVHLNQVYPGTPHATPPCFMAAVHCTLVLSSIYACADRGSIRLPSR